MRGRRPGRALSEAEIQHLVALIDIRDRAMRNSLRVGKLVEEYVLDLQDSGASVRSIADPIGVSGATVHKWAAAARRRRNAMS